MRTIDQVIAGLPPKRQEPPLSAPDHAARRGGSNLGFAVRSMANHTTDEGWQLFQALASVGYQLTGWGIDGTNCVRSALERWNPSTVVIQDKREWIGKTAGRGFDPRERFTDVEALRDRQDVFKVTVLKDAQSDRALHLEAALEAGIHAWVVYYHPRVVSHLCPWVRPEHLIRTWHSLDQALVPKFQAEGRRDCLLSGALGPSYPLRTRLFRDTRGKGIRTLIDVLPHPGYGRRVCHTPGYLHVLGGYKVAICTSSIYGYALRKIIEATACGCAVITDLPKDEVLPEIDCNLIRVDPQESTGEIEEIVRSAAGNWDPLVQQIRAANAKVYYDFRAVGKRLAEDIEGLRRSFP